MRDQVFISKACLLCLPFLVLVCPKTSTAEIQSPEQTYADQQNAEDDTVGRSEHRSLEEQKDDDPSSHVDSINFEMKVNLDSDLTRVVGSSPWDVDNLPDAKDNETTSGVVYTAGIKKLLGTESPRNLSAAFNLLSLSAAEGHEQAQSTLGFLYTVGLGGAEVSPPKAALFHEFAARGGSPTSKLAVAYQWLRRNHVEEAYRLYQDLANLTLTLVQAPSQSIFVEQVLLSTDDTGEESEEARRGHGGEDDDAIQYVQYTAELGNVASMRTMAALYLHGLRGMPRDPARAFELFQAAADAADPHAAVQLGEMLARGMGVPQDYNLSLSYFRFAALQGHVAAVNGLGYMHVYGLGVPQDYAIARANFEAAAAEGDPQGQYNLGMMFLGGVGVQRNPAVAAAYFIKAGASQHLAALYQLARLYMHGIGVPRERWTAVRLFKVVAERGPWGAMLRWAHSRYMQGDHDGALLLYLRAAHMGYTVAQCNAGWMINKGLGVSLFEAHTALGRDAAASMDGDRSGESRTANGEVEGKWSGDQRSEHAEGEADAVEEKEVVGGPRLPRPGASGKLEIAEFQAVADESEVTEDFTVAAEVAGVEGGRGVDEVGVVEEPDKRNSHREEIDVQAGGGSEAEKANLEILGGPNIGSAGGGWLEEEQMKENPSVPSTGRVEEAGMGGNDAAEGEAKEGDRQSARWRAAEVALSMWQLAAEEGDTQAVLRVGDAYLAGRGAPQNPRLAAEAYRWAGKKGSSLALFNLGVMHERGFGVEEDTHLAQRLYKEAQEAEPRAWLAVQLALMRLWLTPHRLKLQAWCNAYLPEALNLAAILETAHQWSFGSLLTKWSPHRSPFSMDSTELHRVHSSEGMAESESLTSAKLPEGDSLVGELWRYMVNCHEVYWSIVTTNVQSILIALTLLILILYHLQQMEMEIG